MMSTFWQLWPFGVLATATGVTRAGALLLAQRTVLRPLALAARVVAATIIALASGLPPAVADPIAYFTGPLSSGGSGLLQIDMATGEVTEIGPYASEIGINSLAFGPDGMLYGVGSNLAGGAHLVAIDPATGAATVVVKLMLSDPSSFFEAMTADACGRLWAQGLLGMPGGGLRESIIAIDPTTGEVEEVVSNPLPSGPRGLAASGETLFTVLYGVLSVLDPATGEITPIAGSSVPNLDLDFAADGFLWGVSGASPVPIPIPVPTSGHTFRVDPQTGDVEVVSENDRVMNGGAAIGPPPGVCGSGPPLAIPAVSPLGLAALAILLAASGMAVARRRPLKPPNAG